MERQKKKWPSNHPQLIPLVFQALIKPTEKKNQKKKTVKKMIFTQVNVESSGKAGLKARNTKSAGSEREKVWQVERCNVNCSFS